MDSNFRKIADYWRREYSNKIQKSHKYKMPAQLKRMASMASPGESFFYVANFHTLNLEMLSDSITKFLNLPIKDVDFHKILSLADSADVERIHLKEKVAKSFFIDFLPPEEVLNYKVQYSYNLRDSTNRKKFMLHLNETASFTYYDSTSYQRYQRCFHPKILKMKSKAFLKLSWSN